MTMLVRLTGIGVLSFAHLVPQGAVASFPTDCVLELLVTEDATPPYTFYDGPRLLLYPSVEVPVTVVGVSHDIRGRCLALVGQDIDWLFSFHNSYSYRLDLGGFDPVEIVIEDEVPRMRGETVKVALWSGSVDRLRDEVGLD